MFNRATNIANETAGGTKIGTFQILNITNLAGTAGLSFRPYNIEVFPTLVAKFDETNTATLTVKDISQYATYVVPPDMPFTDKGTNLPLPITLINFSAALQANQEVLLKWATAMEQDNKEFIVQRSTDALSFTDVKTLAGAGNSLSAREYVTSDEYPISGTSYYRLKQVDFDGTTSFSKVASVRIKGSAGSGLSVQSAKPNPFQGQTEINFSVPAPAKVTLTVSDALGKVIATEKINAQAGANTYLLKGDKLSNGVYFLNLTNGRESSRFKVVRTN
jgi:hypothetical protein